MSWKKEEIINYYVKKEDLLNYVCEIEHSKFSLLFVIYCLNFVYILGICTI